MLSRFARFAMIAFALAAGSQARATPLAYGTYYDDHVDFTCPSTNNCRVNFGQLPSDKLLMVSKIHCGFATGSPVLSAVFYASATSGGGPIQRFIPLVLPAPLNIGNTSYLYSFREDAHFLIGQGRFPYISLGNLNSATFTGGCTLIGDLVTPIQ